MKWWGWGADDVRFSDEDKPALAPFLRRHLDLETTAPTARPVDFAALAPVIGRVAAGGDLRANSLLTLAVEELALHVRTLARRLFVDERATIPVALAGGLLGRSGGVLRKRVEQRLRTAVPGSQVRQEPVDPARGAVRGALKLLGVEIS